MNYNKYTTEYRKLILKESLRKGLNIKRRIINIINFTDDKGILERLLRTNIFDEKFASNKAMLGDFGRDDEELRNLIEQDTGLMEILRKTVEDKLKELEEQEQDEEKDKTQGELEQENDYEEQEGYRVKSHETKANIGTRDNALIKEDPETHRMYCEPLAMIIRDGSVLTMLKLSAISSINMMRDTKMLVDKCHSPEMLAYMCDSRSIYDEKAKQLAKTYIDMPECDEELKMLAEQIVIEGQQVNEKVDRYIEQLRESLEQNSKGDKQEEIALEEQQQEEEKRVTENGNTPRKSWELPPKQKEEIQRSTQQVAQEHMEKQESPQQEEAEPIVEESNQGSR